MKKFIALFLFLFIPIITVASDLQKYTLSTGDKIKILVYGENDLTLEITLDDDGIISYPFLGDIMVKGLSLGEVENKIKAGLLDGYIHKPNVNVSIIEYRPFFVNGEVKKDGAYPFQPGLTVQQAISIAGGLTERASKKNIFVIHKNSLNRIRVKKSDLLQPGDTLSIEESFF
jgi:polysaccharide biosynthesis/export protein VpsN